MCGRYVSRSEKQRIAETFAAGILPEDYDPDFVPDLPNYNVAPQSRQWVIRQSPATGQRELLRMKWGLVPFWSKDSRIAYSTINARAETLATSALYRAALKTRRCLIPADAFYEWQKLDARHKQPYAIAMQDDSLFAFAGLWETWKDKAADRELCTFTIVTTDPNELMQPIHNRMPVIVPRQDYARWLAPADSGQLPTDLLRPFPANQMKSWKIGSAVGNTRNHGPALLRPAEPEPSMISNLFPD